MPNRLHHFWLPAIHPLTSACTLETAKQHALGSAAWGYTALGITAAEIAIPGKWPVVGLLFVGMLGMMSLELVIGYAAMPVGERKVFQWSHEIVGKILLVSLVAVSVVLDGLILLTAEAIDFSYLPVLRSGWPFVTCTTLLWLILAQIAGVIEHVRTSEGSENIPPTIEFMVRQVKWGLDRLRRVDSVRYQQTHPGEEPPARWPDNLSDEQLARIFAIVEEAAPSAPAAEVLTMLPPPVVETPVADPHSLESET
jgi:hypothetical protein